MAGGQHTILLNKKGTKLNGTEISKLAHKCQEIERYQKNKVMRSEARENKMECQPPISVLRKKHSRHQGIMHSRRAQTDINNTQYCEQKLGEKKKKRNECLVIAAQSA